MPNALIPSSPAHNQQYYRIGDYMSASYEQCLKWSVDLEFESVKIF